MKGSNNGHLKEASDRSCHYFPTGRQKAQLGKATHTWTKYLMYNICCFFAKILIFHLPKICLYAVYDTSQPGMSVFLF